MTFSKNQSLPQSTSRRGMLIRLISGSIVAFGGQFGCQAFRRQSEKAADDGVVCLVNPSAIPRRFFIAATSAHQRIIGGIENQFVKEVIAALNSISNCNAILLPPHFSLEALSGPDGVRPEMSGLVDVYSPDAALEELLLIHVVEMIPYRPMRLSAVLERRHVSDGTLISRDHRTWNAPTDDQPLAPNKFTRFILNHPQPLSQVEAEEMGRLSPLTFMKDVAREIAIELMATPV